MPRRTIRNKTSLEGVGLHKGRQCLATFLPAEGPTGVRFYRPGLTGPVKASLETIATTVRGTNLSDGDRIVYTVEHILSACAGLGIDDLDIILDSEEPPAADGSALPIAALLKSAGFLQKPDQERRLLKLEKAVEYAFEKTFYRASPAERSFFRISFSHPHPLIGTQTFAIALTPESYLTEVAPARTFGFKSELARLKAAGLALGGSLENAIVIDDAPGAEKVFLSAGGTLRFPDELVRHKLLDLIGDLALTGLALDRISVEAAFTGHKSNAIFAKMLVENRSDRVKSD